MFSLPFFVEGRYFSSMILMKLDWIDLYPGGVTREYLVAWWGSFGSVEVFLV